MNYIDVHCHLTWPEYTADLDLVMARSRALGVGMITVGTDVASSRAAVALAEKHPDVWAAIGLHPTEIQGEFETASYTALASHPKVVAIGECGLDYSRDGYKNASLQKTIFEEHIALANEVKKPLILHVRNGTDGHNAYNDAYEIVKNSAKVPGDVHFFAGSWQEGKRFIDRGFRLSFTGVITFARDYDEVIRNAPRDMIMSETDAPFVAPLPHRGKRNEPSFVTEVVRKLADIRSEDPAILALQLVDNARKLFAIS